jgi:UDP-N-acetylglucosamine acyltransferase
LLGGHVTIADRVFLGGGCVFHQHTCVGRLVITQGISGFSKDIPPFTLAAQVNRVAGLNVVGLRRAGFSSAQRLDIKRAFLLVYASGRNVREALLEARDQPFGPEAREFLDFVANAKKRGICGKLRTVRGQSAEEGE